MISILVYTARGSYGTLSLYAPTPHAFDGDDLATAQALAGHLAVALAAGHEIEGMSAALQSRTVIGQAEGILMERLGVDSDQALAYLKRISSHTNTSSSRSPVTSCGRGSCPRRDALTPHRSGVRVGAWTHPAWSAGPAPSRRRRRSTAPSG